MEIPAIQALKALADETRLRILRVLAREPLNVNELLQVLGMGQSRVSRHLKIMSDAGILEGQRAGSRVYYGLNSRMHESSVLSGLLDALRLGVFTGDSSHLPLECAEDERSLNTVLEGRKQDSLNHFQKYGADQEQLQQGLVDGRYYRNKILDLLPDNSGTTADLGCGTGELAELLRGRAHKLVGVDQSRNMLERAQLVCPEGDFRIGALDHLPLGDGEADTVIASMVLHHLPEPMTALREIHRVLRPGGAVVIADLNRHEEEIMRTRFADFWLGFRPRRIRDYLRDVGFEADLEESGKGEGTLECLFFRAVKIAPGTGSEIASARSEKDAALADN